MNTFSITQVINDNGDRLRRPMHIDVYRDTTIIAALKAAASEWNIPVRQLRASWQLAA